MAKRTKEALLNRLDEALKDLYHNATPHHPYNLMDSSDEEWYYDYFQFMAEMAIDDLQTGLGCSVKGWKRQEKLGFIYNERYFWLVQRITEWGKLYTWGRGGRTLAPNDLIKQRGGSSFSILYSEYFGGYSNAYLTDMIQVLEAFNHYVEEWNSAKNLAEMFKEEKNQRQVA